MATTLAIMFITLGILIFFAAVIIKYVPPPWKWVVEWNLPGMKSRMFVWDSGIHFLWLPIRPLMFIKNRLFCADKTIVITLGVDDNNPGDKNLVEFKDASAGVKAQLTLRVIDPIAATYNVGDYEKAAIERVEASFRKLLATMTLDEAMENVDNKRSAVTQETFREVNEAIKDWGVKLTNRGEELTIVDFLLSPSVIEERQKVLQANKNLAATVKSAEAQSQVDILLGQGAGKGESLKLSTLMKDLGLTAQEAIDYMLRRDMTEAVKGSTLIATSEGGELNVPARLGAMFLGTRDATVNRKPSVSSTDNDSEASKPNPLRKQPKKDKPT